MGIGTTAPNTKLYVKAAAAGTIASFFASGIASGETTTLLLGESAGSGGVEDHYRAAAFRYYNGAGVAADSHLSIFNFGDGQTFSIWGGGKIGFNATGVVPTAIVHLKAGTTAATTAPIKFTSGSLMTVPEAGAMEFLTDELYFTQTTGPTRRKIIADDGFGNVGIGTTSPTTKLDIIGSASVSQDFEVGGDLIVSGDLVGGTSISGNFDPTTDNTYDLGNATYRWKDLHLGPDSLNIYSTTGTSGAGSDYTLGELKFGSGASLSLGTNAVGTGSEGTLELRTNDTSRLFISSGGNVGIGTTVPDGKLHVFTNSAGTVTPHGSADELVLENNSDAGLSIITPDASLGRIAFTSPSTTGDFGARITYQQSTNLMSIGPGGGSLFLSGSYVGIGTTGPVSLLTIGSGTPTTAANGLNFGTDTSANLYRSAAATIKTDGALVVTGAIKVTTGDLWLAAGAILQSAVKTAGGTALVHNEDGYYYDLTSSARYKDNIRYDYTPGPEALQRFLALSPAMWDYKNGMEIDAVSFISEDLAELDITNSAGRSILTNYNLEGLPESNKDYTIIALQHLILQMHDKSIQEQQEQIASQAIAFEDLQAQVASLSFTVDQLIAGGTASSSTSLTASGSSSVTVTSSDSPVDVLATLANAVMTKVQLLWATGDIIAEGIKKTYFAVSDYTFLDDDILNWGSRNITISNTATDTVRGMLSGNGAQAADQSRVDLVNPAAAGGAYLATYGVDSTRGEIQLSGTGQLTDGEAKVYFDYSFTELISDTAPIRVIITPTSRLIGQLYVDYKSIYGFTVKELSAQESGAFDWLVIARRKGFEETDATPTPIPDTTVSPTPTPTPTPEPDATVSPTPEITPTLTPSESPAPSPSESPTPTPTPTPTPDSEPITTDTTVTEEPDSTSSPQATPEAISAPAEL